nr:GFA family protein [Flavimaribacter sediminis]
MSTKKTTGGCQCGAVRYSVDGELSDPHICHCRMCQKAAGNYFMPLAGAKREQFHVTRGAISWFRSSEPVRRGFCNRCGTPLIFDALASDHYSVTLGSLDQPDLVAPLQQFGTEAQMPWFKDLAGLEAHETGTDGEMDDAELSAIAASNRQHPDHDTENWDVQP